MGFLYKHYEKIILALFLIVFVMALIYLIMVFSQSKEITEEDLKIHPEGADYTRIFDDKGKEIVQKGDQPKYAELKNLAKSEKWIASTKRNPASLDYSDLMIPFKAARCEKCMKLIPCVAFKNKECPICHQDPGKVRKEQVESTELDKDKDGIPDLVERKLKLDPSDPADAWTDLDNDGFPNITEYKAKTDLIDPKSHPALANRLALIGIKRKKLSLKLVNVKKDGTDKKNWIIQVKVPGRRGRWTTEFKRIGETLKLDSRGRDIYTITDAHPEMKEEFDKKLNMPVQKNVSTITIQNVLDRTDKPITLRVGSTVYENKARLGFKDTLTDKKYYMRDGESFKVMDKNSKPEGYKVTAVSSGVPKDKEWAKILDKNNKIYKIGRKSLIEQEKEEAGIEKEDAMQQGSGLPSRRANPKTPDIPGDI